MHTIGVIVKRDAWLSNEVASGLVVQRFPKFGPTHAEYSQELADALERRALLATLEPTNVVAMHLRLRSQLLLREASRKAEITED
jgi:hypothetical protein